MYQTTLEFISCEILVNVDYTDDSGEVSLDGIYIINEDGDRQDASWLLDQLSTRGKDLLQEEIELEISGRYAYDREMARELRDAP